MKTGKITYITPKGKGTPFIDNQTGEQVTLDNYNIGFADGTEYKFKAKGQWKYPVGSEIQFEVSNADWKTAKGAKLINTATPKQNINVSKTVSTNDSILLQVCYKENMQAFAKDHKDSVMAETEKDFLALKQILNNL